MAAAALPVWKLEDAKARFSELVRLAGEAGPQRVTVRGRDAAVVMSAAEYARLVPPLPQRSLADLFDSFTDTSHIDLEIEKPPIFGPVRAPPTFD